MNGTFYEQLGSVAGVFEQWGACERTVVACALTRRVPLPGLKLVQLTVEAALRNHIDDERLERDANDEQLLATLLAAVSEGDEEEGCDHLRRLLTLVPHLRSENDRCMEVLVSGVATVVQRCVDAPRRSPAAPTPDLCRQLLSYMLVHPALSRHDHKTLTPWLRYLENYMAGNRNPESVWQQRIDPCLIPDANIWSSNNTFRRTIGKNVEFRSVIDSIDHYTTDLLQESFSKNGRDVDISIEGEKLNFDAAISQPKSQRSNSLTPPSTNFMHMSSSAENLSDEPFVQKPRSFSLSSEHSLSQIRPISIMYGTTGSETRLDDLRSHNFTEHPGMSTVALWLKSLRLHKYVWLFTNITYDQMMAMDDKYLEKLGVTKGARHKLLLSIKKLSERQTTLESIEAELSSGAAGAGRALERLRTVLLSPMPPASELPAAIVRALHLASKNVSTLCLPGGTGAGVGGGVGGGVGAGVGVGSRLPAVMCLGDEEHESPVDPMSLHCWLVEKALHHEAFSGPELQAALKRLRHRLPPGQFFHHVSDMPLNRRCPKPRWRIAPHSHSGYSKPLHKRVWPAAGKGPTPPHARGKSHSYPPFPPSAVLPRPPHHPPTTTNTLLTDDYSSLDALCLQMTEQAIN